MAASVDINLAIRWPKRRRSHVQPQRQLHPRPETGFPGGFRCHPVATTRKTMTL
ncbi:hypothetical protein SESBI_02575 [Sesbania bispinosa]|nr:hypothetical protein SESBI_02575 [Sesbania bispinosa]